MRRMTGLVGCVAGCLLVSGTMLTGCTGATKAGTTFTQLPTRELQAVFNGSLAHVHNTAVKVVQNDLQYKLDKEGHDALEGIIEAKNSKDEPVIIETYKVTDDTTKIRVNAGFMSSRGKGAEILSMIENKLGTTKATSAGK